MSVELTGLVLYTGVLFIPGGAVNRWTRVIQLEFVRAASEEAPLNKRANKGRAALPIGSLRAGINGSVSMLGSHELEIEVASDAPYSIYVLKGTGIIFARSARIPAGHSDAGRFRPVGPGQGMYLPTNIGYGKSKFVQRVSGQHANNFMQRAADRVAVSHPALRGMTVF